MERPCTSVCGWTGCTSIPCPTCSTGRGRAWPRCWRLEGFPHLRLLTGVEGRAGVGELVLSSGAGPDVRATTHARRRDSTLPAPGGPERVEDPAPPRSDDCGSTTGGGRTGTAGGPTVAVVTMRQLLEAGVHFGHQTRRWNPKMKRFIYGERNGIYIIDLQKTSAAIESTYGFLRDTVAKGGNVLFVGTRRRAQEPTRPKAERVGMPYVNFRWLGGMLTNFTTIYKRLQRLKELEAMEATRRSAGLPQKEGLRL